MYKLIITFILFYSYNSYGQYGYYKDVVKFGQYFNSGTARVQALGGATASLGGDVSSITINPAGLGFFNKKVFSAINADRGLWVSIILQNFPDSIILLREDILFEGSIFCENILSLNAELDIFFV